MIRRGVATAVVVMLSVGIACGPDRQSPATKRGDTLTARSSGIVPESPTEPGWVWLHTSVVLSNKGKPVKLEAASPLTLPRGVELVEARAWYVRKDGLRLAGGFPGGVCTAKWPPPGFGGAVPLEQASVGPDDLVAVLFYVRGTAIGQRLQTSGARIRYRQGGDTRVQEFPDGTGLILEVVPTGRGVAAGGGCPETNVWLQPEA